MLSKHAVARLVGLLAFGTLFFIACVKDYQDTPAFQSPLEEVLTMMQSDDLDDTQLRILFEKVAALPEGQAHSTYIQSDHLLDADAPTAPASVYCKWSVTGVQGGVNCGDPDGDGNVTVCVKCDDCWPGEDGCPQNVVGTVWRHYNAQGQLICTGTITGTSQACLVCPDGFKVKKRKADVEPQQVKIQHN